MKYCDFCQAFYISRSDGCINRIRSQEKIPEYLIKAAIKEDSWDLLPLSGSAYGKWFSGKNSPDGNVWSTILRDFNEDVFSEKLFSDLFDNHLELLLDRFGVTLDSGALVNKEGLCRALGRQLYAIAENNGEADIVVGRYYTCSRANVLFPAYAERTLERYKEINTVLYGSEDRIFDDIYVCNTISNRPGVNYTRRRQQLTKEIEDATLEKIAEFSNRVILIGNGGMGKSLMLQHLLIESVKRHHETGTLPVIVKLHNHNYKTDDLVSYIIKVVQRRDDSFTNELAHRALTAGKFQIMMDGVDEVDPGDIKEFQKQLSELTDRYPNNQYVLASRECEAVRSINGFMRLYLMPFNKEQSLALINKLISDEESEVKNDIATFMDNGFMRKHSGFATNPMLLTFIIMKHPIEETSGGKPYRFFRSIYEIILSGHDEVKEAYDRIFRSVADPEEFTKVFRELCANTYPKCIFEFDQTTFEEHFNQLKSISQLSNPGMMKKKTFLHDACATACMMYEDDPRVLYVDKGFQEYLFAEYNFYAEPESVIEVGKSLWHTPLSSFDDDSAFDMLYDMSPDKVETCLFIPYLNKMFVGKSEDQAFAMFLRNGFDRLAYVSVDMELVQEYERKKGLESVSIRPATNEPSTVILSMILKRAGTSPCFEFMTEGNSVRHPEYATSVIAGEVGFDGETQKIMMRRLPVRSPDEIESYERTHNVESCIRDDEGKILCFGREYSFSLKQLVDEPDKHSELLGLLKNESEVHNMYLKVKDYYEAVVEKHRDEEY